MTDRDRLILDVETDGSVTPREAVASAGGTLLELVNLFAELAEAASVTVGPAEDEQLPERLPDHDRGAEPVGALLQLPEARGHQHGRRPGAEVRVRADGHPQLRAEVDRRGQGQARGARASVCGRSSAVPKPKKGPRLGSEPGPSEADALHAREAAVRARGDQHDRGQGEDAPSVRREADHVRQARRPGRAARGAEGHPGPRRRRPAVPRDRAAVRRAAGRLHADPEAGAARRATARRWRASSSSSARAASSARFRETGRPMRVDPARPRLRRHGVPRLGPAARPGASGRSRGRSSRCSKACCATTSACRVAGRTDAGVHARGQVASFVTPSRPCAGADPGRGQRPRSRRRSSSWRRVRRRDGLRRPVLGDARASTATRSTPRPSPIRSPPGTSGTGPERCRSGRCAPRRATWWGSTTSRRSAGIPARASRRFATSSG